jgi:ankyrin repeat protein
MYASQNGHLEVVRTLLEVKADINAQNKVRNQMMMMIIIIMMIMIVIDVFMLIIDNMMMII